MSADLHGAVLAVPSGIHDAVGAHLVALATAMHYRPFGVGPNPHGDRLHLTSAAAAAVARAKVNVQRPQAPRAVVPVPSGLLPAASCPLPAASCLLPVASCPLPTDLWLAPLQDLLLHVTRNTEQIKKPSALGCQHSARTTPWNFSPVQRLGIRRALPLGVFAI